MDSFFNNRYIDEIGAGVFRLFLWGILFAGIQACSSSGPDQRFDYYPVKVEPEFASGFRVYYFPSYKRVEIVNPMDSSHIEHTYFLVEHGTKPPENEDEFPVIRVPLSNFSCLSTTHIPFLKKLDQLTKLAGVGHTDRIIDSTLAQQIEEGWTLEITSSGQPDIERILYANTHVLFAYPFDAYALTSLDRLNIPVVYVGEYKEKSALARAEWMKFFALFFNQEKQANQWFDQIKSQYQEVQQLIVAHKAVKKPTVFYGSQYQDVWYAPDAQSLMAHLIRDAGGEYFTDQLNQGENLILSIETLVGAMDQIDFWGEIIPETDTLRAADFMFSDSRLKEMALGNDVSFFGVNTQTRDYFGQAIIEPHVLLKDLGAIFYPDLYHTHRFMYFQPIKEKG